MMRRTLAALAILLAAGCATPEPAPADPGAPPVSGAEDACGAAQYAGMVGTSIAAATFPEGVRVIGPDTMVTKDYRIDRLNVLVDANGVITAFECG